VNGGRVVSGTYQKQAIPHAFKWAGGKQQAARDVIAVDARATMSTAYGAKKLRLV